MSTGGDDRALRDNAARTQESQVPWRNRLDRRAKSLCNAAAATAQQTFFARYATFYTECACGIHGPENSGACAGSVRLEAIRRPYVGARAQPVGQVGWSGGNAERLAVTIAGSRRPGSATSRVRTDVSEGLGW